MRSAVAVFAALVCAIATAPRANADPPVLNGTLRYQLQCAGGVNAIFAQATDLDDAVHSGVGPGTRSPAKRAPIAFARGVITSPALSAWAKSPSPKDCTVLETSTDGTVVVQYQITGAVPLKLAFSSLDTGASEVVTMNLSISYDRVTKQ